MDLDVLLMERAHTHGEYRDDARAAMALLDIINQEEARRRSRKQDPLGATARHSLRMIAFKIARILTGREDYPDHWDDIAGYAKLVSDRIPRPATVPEAEGCADDCTHPSHAPVNGADVLGLNRKAPCACRDIDRCLVDQGTPPKYAFCRKAEEAGAH